MCNVDPLTSVRTLECACPTFRETCWSPCNRRARTVNSRGFPTKMSRIEAKVKSFKPICPPAQQTAHVIPSHHPADPIDDLPSLPAAPSAFISGDPPSGPCRQPMLHDGPVNKAGITCFAACGMEKAERDVISAGVRCLARSLCRETAADVMARVRMLI
jgi:hypothetical protein